MNPEVKKHYDNLLAEVYSWMSGDIKERAEEAKKYFHSVGITDGAGKTAVDLGAGYGIHTKALCEIGYNVTAVDFSSELLDELQKNVPAAKTVNADIEEYNFSFSPDIILCMGDTLTHLKSKSVLHNLISRISSALYSGGTLFLSWRDLSCELQGTSRFIPVKSDDKSILTCFLEYTSNEYVTVNDLLYTKDSGKWEFRTGSYRKLRLGKDYIGGLVSNLGFEVISAENIRGMEHFVCKKI